MEKKPPEIKFEVLSDGLGFHPFSDGLPYAPMSKSRSEKGQGTQSTPNSSPNHPSQPSRFTQGSGAVSAGVPRFARVSVPVAGNNPSRAQASAQLQSHIKARAQAQAAQEVPAFQVETTYGFGYLIRRVLAYLVDTATNLTLGISALAFALWRQDLNPESLLSPGVVLISALFFAAFNWALITAQEIAFKTTVGKRLFGLALYGSAAATFLRAFFFLPSLGFCGIGLIWAVFDSRRRCWHDVAVDLQPSLIAKL